MDEKNKWAFWAFVLAALAIICVPSTILLETWREYERFFAGFEPQTLRPKTAHFLPHKGAANPAPAEPRLEFVEFKLRAPKAKKVFLIGEFNGWKPGTLALTPQAQGNWELLLPLPPGRHHYQFVVDGQAVLDPRNRQTEEAAGRTASVRVVR